MGQTGNTFEIKPFFISKYPVTNLEYEEFDRSHSKRRDQFSDQDDQPVVDISWDEAVQYCQWLSEQTGEDYRLPTEAEWEFAASGGTQRLYPWGNEEPGPELANYYHKSKLRKTTPLGAYIKGKTPEGLFDMAGNVWEWCADWYDERKCWRVVRGGSFINNSQINLRCACRYGYDPRNRLFTLGFRVVRAAQS